jgi:hypothetical protein
MHPISRTPAVHAVRRRAARWPQGKTCVIAALVLSNPAANLKPVSDAAFKLLTSPDGATHKYKVTVIVVNNTLVEQASSLGCNSAQVRGRARSHARAVECGMRSGQTS